MTLYQVLLSPELTEKFQYLFDGLAEVHVLDSGETVAQMTCTQIDTSGQYVEAIVSSILNGEPRRVLLNHSFVVAILEVVNLKTQAGFVHQEERPE
jgi:wyosine [tRNA(Phe)-imidazoG37] synthetase (radical SAM superfamily)